MLEKLNFNVNCLNILYSCVLCNRSAAVFLSENLSLLQPILVLLHEFFSERLEAWASFENVLSVSLLHETSWVSHNIGVNTSPEEIAHIDLGAIADHPFTVSEVLLDLLEAGWHDLSMHGGVSLLFIISQGSSPFESAVDNWLVLL